MGLEAGQSLLGTEHSSPVEEILIISIDAGWLQVCILFLKIGISCLYQLMHIATLIKSLLHQLLYINL